MDLIEDMFRHIATSVFGRTDFKVLGHTIDFGKPWRRISMPDAVKEKYNIDFREIKTVEEANEKLRSIGMNEAQPSIGEALVKAFEGVEKELIQPTLVYGHPIEISPLAKPLASDPRYVERFEIFIAGMECGDNWSEQNDPVHLLETWRKSYKSEERDAGKFHTLDFDFIEALEYGMPPTTGIGPGIERMAMIFTGQENIDDIIFFPLMRPSVGHINAQIYGIREQPLAPVENLALSENEFEGLCKDGQLKPQTTHITVKPHLRLWPGGRYTGHADLESFVADSTVHLTGFNIELPKTVNDDEAKEIFVGKLEATLIQFLRKTFPQCQLTFSPPTLMRA
jgi:lysyl-tRNA synthetase class 2